MRLPSGPRSCPLGGPVAVFVLADVSGGCNHLVTPGGKWVTGCFFPTPSKPGGSSKTTKGWCWCRCQLPTSGKGGRPSLFFPPHPTDHRAAVVGIGRRYGPGTLQHDKADSDSQSVLRRSGGRGPATKCTPQAAGVSGVPPYVLPSHTYTHPPAHPPHTYMYTTQRDTTLCRQAFFKTFWQVVFAYKPKRFQKMMMVSPLNPGD